MTTRAAHTEEARERLLMATAALGSTRRDSELAAHIDALIAAVRHEAVADRLHPTGVDNQQEAPCRSSDAPGAVDCGGTVSPVARSVSSAEATARAWLDRQIVKDGREPMLDEGDCRMCGRGSGDGHEPSDPCGIVKGLLDLLHPHEDGEDNGCGPDQAAPTTETYREEIPIGPASGYDDPPEDEQTDQARSGVRVPITEQQQLIDRLAEIRDVFIASGDEADAMDAGVIDYAMFKLGQEWVTRVTSEDEDSPSVIGYRGNPTVSEAGRSAQSASAIQHLQSAPPEDEQTDQARSGVDDTEPRLTIQLPDDVSAKMRDNAAFVLRRHQANKLRAVAEWFRDCKTLTLENMPHGLIAALEAGAATLRAEERDMAGLIDVLQVAFRDASNRHCSADYLEGMNEAITLVESHLREAQ